MWEMMAAAINKEDTEQAIQDVLAEMTNLLEKARALADQHQIEFTWMGLTQHYRNYYDYGPTPTKSLAKTGFFIADSEWESSGMNCSPSSGFYEWQRANWPEDFDDEDDC